MPNYNDACRRLDSGLVVRRQAWNGEKALVEISVGNSGFTYTVVINKDGSLHGDDQKIQRYIFSDEDKAAGDWEWKECEVELIRRDRSKLN
jgi:hypothetical protein